MLAHEWLELLRLHWRGVVVRLGWSGGEGVLTETEMLEVLIWVLAWRWKVPGADVDLEGVLALSSPLRRTENSPSGTLGKVTR